MIDFRYLLVTIASVFVAIATGLVLGAGPLGEAGRADDPAGPAPAELRERLISLQQRASYAEQVASATGAETLRGRLEGRRVALVALPGADGRIVRELTRLLPTTGATVTRSLQVTPKWVDPSERQFLDDLSAELMTGEVEVPGGSAYDRAATVLAGAVFDARPASDIGDASDDTAASDDVTAEEPPAATPTTSAEESAGPTESTEPSESAGAADSATVLGAYDEGDLVRSGRDEGPAELAVVIAPDPQEYDENLRRSDGAVWLALVRAFDRTGEGTVVAGPAAAARGTGALSVVRSDAAASSEASTVDVADREVGPAVVALALAEQAEGESGHYGMVGPVDGALPG